MARGAPAVISGAVEGTIDEVVLRRLVVEAGGIPGTVYGGQGKSHLKRQIRGYNNSARFRPWVVLVDLDDDAGCAAALARNWLSVPSPFMRLRVALSEIEAWLIADREGLAHLLQISSRRIRTDPEHLDNPKQTIVNLARSSRNRLVCEDIVPRPRAGREVGPGYALRMSEFADRRWRPRVAARHSTSLARAIERIAELV